MGMLRLYLALCIVVAHSRHYMPFAWLDPLQAVQVFFLISGFYMELILTRKYASTCAFYSNRFLRIFVPYWTCLLLVVLISMMCRAVCGDALAMQSYFDGQTGKNGIFGVCLAALSNVTIFFQDAVSFIQDEAGKGVSLVVSMGKVRSPLHHYLLIPQCWSVGVELLFYLCVPLLHKMRTPWLLAAVAGAMVLRIAGYERLGLAHDPWMYRFFVFEIGLFVLGMVSCRLYLKLDGRKYFSFISRNRSGILVIAVEILFLTIFMTCNRHILAGIGPAGYRYIIFATYAALAILMPVVFMFSRNSVFDRFVGELSYPVYLVHFIVIQLLHVVLTRLRADLAFLTIWSIFFSVAAAAALYFAIIRPLDRYRESRLRHTRPLPASSG
jgi:peptidoglycan/LPS O-acetylase OafA/YrhL